MAGNPVQRKSVHPPDYRSLYPTEVRILIKPEESESVEDNLLLKSLIEDCCPTSGWRADPSVPGAMGENGEISLVEAQELFGVEPGDDPNCFHSDNDFVVVSASHHPGFELLRTGREGFGKVFFWRSKLSGFEWRLKCEYASSKTGAWQQPVFALHHVLSPEAHVGIVLTLREPHLDTVCVGRIYKGSAADRCGVVHTGDEVVAINGKRITEAVTAFQGPSARTVAAGRDLGGRDPLAKAALLKARTDLLGAQGTFVWLTLRRRCAGVPAVRSDYLPRFGPHIRFEGMMSQDEELQIDRDCLFQVRLLRGDAMYVGNMLAYDWKLDMEELLADEAETQRQAFLTEQILQAAADGDDVSITRLLRSRADPNSKNAAAVPPLHLAAFHGHNTTVALLAASRAFVNQGDCFQASALHKAARRGHVDVVHTLVEFGADVNHVDIWESSALHWAAVESRSEVVAVLADLGTDGGQLTTDGLLASKLSEAYLTTGYPYAGLRESQRQDRQEKLLRSVYQALAARAFWGIIEAWRQEWMDKADEIRAREREAAAERTRQREAAAERSLSLQKELAAEQQHQRNLLAAAGMSFAR